MRPRTQATTALQRGDALDTLTLAVRVPPNACLSDQRVCFVDSSVLLRYCGQAHHQH